MGNEPDLGAPGKPLETWIDRPDGTRSLYPVPQTKWDNCAHLMRELQGRLPTDDELAEWQLTRREHELFLDDQPDGQVRPARLPQDGLNRDRDGQGQR
jgi:hypothetical protein